MTTTAFVLSGGGSLGAVQVGMLQALRDHDISPDLLVGASAGALNGTYAAVQICDLNVGGSRWRSAAHAAHREPCLCQGPGRGRARAPLGERA